MKHKKLTFKDEQIHLGADTNVYVGPFIHFFFAYDFWTVTGWNKKSFYIQEFFF